MKLDFKEIRERVPLLDAARFLGLELKAESSGAVFRTKCPACNRNTPRSLSVTPHLGRFACFANGKHNAPRGDVIELVAHCRGVPQRAAAELLAQHFGLVPNGQPTVPQRPEAGTNRPTASPGQKPGVESVHGKLTFDHPHVRDWTGLSAEDAERLGVGWRQSGGSLSGRLLIPLRLQTGEPVGYLGYHPGKDPVLKAGKITLA